MGYNHHQYRVYLLSLSIALWIFTKCLAIVVVNLRWQEYIFTCTLKSDFWQLNPCRKNLTQFNPQPVALLKTETLQQVIPHSCSVHRIYKALLNKPVPPYRRSFQIITYLISNLNKHSTTTARTWLILFGPIVSYTFKMPDFTSSTFFHRFLGRKDHCDHLVRSPI